MRSAAFAACLVLSACSNTGNFGTILPPAEYDHPHPALNIGRYPLETVREKCGHPHVLGCSIVSDGKRPCPMIIPDTAPIGGAIYRHERAHCNGWPANHPR